LRHDNDLQVALANAQFLSAGDFTLRVHVLALLLMCCAPFVVPVHRATAQCLACGDVACLNGQDCAMQGRSHPFHGQATYRPDATHRSDIVAHPTCDGSPLQLRRCTGFHGKYYGRPYNFRNLFDYPWHEPLRLTQSSNVIPSRIKTIPSESVPEGSLELPSAPPAAPSAQLFDTSWVQSSDNQQQAALRFRTAPKQNH
ncbi:MAG TPA: hypothetical protein VMX74_16075, partial [Pirellulales bacterium]|nr:hypothetical protein [Pirellulales bacterium]